MSTRRGEPADGAYKVGAQLRVAVLAAHEGDDKVELVTELAAQVVYHVALSLPAVAHHLDHERAELADLGDVEVLHVVLFLGPLFVGTC